jgi:hypothetical protein
MQGMVGSCVSSMSWRPVPAAFGLAQQMITCGMWQLCPAHIVTLQAFGCMVSCSLKGTYCIHGFS